jgi:uncharacterized protein (DUF488 family)
VSDAPDSAPDVPGQGRTVFTIGHSTRSLDEFLSLLKAHGITAVADVRTVPKSRRHPHFAGEALARELPGRGIEYRHFPGLGGLRKPRRDSRNGGWRHESFRGYADHMASPAFIGALEALLAWAAGDRVVAVMCAEAKWWQCHRQLIADAVLVRGTEVRHVMSAREAPLHRLTPFAQVDGLTVFYPALM